MLDGGAGDDTYVYNLGDGNDVITGNTDGTDTLQFGAGITLDNLVVSGNTSSYLYLTMPDGAVISIDNYFGTGRTNIEILQFNDGSSVNLSSLVEGITFTGGGGNDRFFDNIPESNKYVALDGDDQIYAGDGNDTLDAGNGNDFLDGGNGNDLLLGGAGNDQLHGDAGNDTLIGGLGDDVLDGGAGDDTYVYNLGDGNDVITGNTDGTDTLQFGAGITLDNIVLVRESNTNNLLINLPDSSLIRVDNYFGDGGTNIELIQFSDGTTVSVDDMLHTLNGTPGNDNLVGNANFKIINGLAGDDTLTGSGSSDTLFGGVGNDTYMLTSLNDKIVERPNEGTDTVIVNTNVSYALGANLENLTLVNGSFDVNATGNELDNILIGNTGSNIFNGGAGNDTMDGGLGGHDTYLFADGWGNDSVINSTGVDTVDLSSVTTNITANMVAGAGPEVSSAGNTINWNKLVIGANTFDSIGNLFTGSGDDSVIGNSLDNLIQTGAGNDTLDGGTGSNTCVFQDHWGQDSINHAGSNDTLDFSATTIGSNIDLYFGTADDKFGNMANDSLTWQGDTITKVIGGSGNDEIGDYTSHSVFLSGNDGNDLLVGSLAGNDTLIGGNGDDTLRSAAGGDFLDGGAGNDTYQIAVDPNGSVTTIADASGNDTMDLRSLNVDSVIDLTGTSVSTSATSSVQWNANAIENVLGGTGADTITGNAADNLLSGEDGNDLIQGNGGNDTLVGGVGNDTLMGGTGNDVYQGYTTGAFGQDVINDIAGTADKLDLSGFTSSSVMIAAVDNNDADSFVNDLQLSFTNGRSILINNYFDNTSQDGAGAGAIETIQFSDKSMSFSDIQALFGPVNLVHNGTSDNDIITGGVGNDTINGLAGDDLLSGLAGNDSISGGDGNDTLDGGTGADILVGGLGSDTYIVDNLQDQVIETGGSDTDTVISSVDFTLGSNVENLTLSGSAFKGTGNSLDNVLIGNSGANQLIGGVGNDTLDGGAGADTLIGGLGNDTYLVDNFNDVIQENPGEGIDTIISSVSFALNTSAGANVENITLTGTSLTAFGNSLDNIMIGNSNDNYLFGDIGNDTLNGGAGNDTLDGSKGNDTYIYTGAWGQDSITDTSGTDTLDLSAISNGLTVNLTSSTTGNEVTDGANTINWSASDTLETVGADSITGDAGTNKLVGNVGNDTLTGGAGNDTLDGGAGDDSLTGGVGNDTLDGGAGDDIYAFGVNFGTDSIIEAVGNGNDTLDFSALGATNLNVDLSVGAFTQGTNKVTWTAGNIENLTTSFGSDTLTGTTGNNTFNGAAGNDTYKFAGAWGQDSIVDSSGNDTLDLSAISNGLTINLISSTGNEVTDGTNTINWASGVALETVLGGSGADSITGDGAANKLVGNVGNDTLTGGAGTDTLDGGAGDDTYMFAAGFGTDNIIEAAGNGSDTLDFSGFTTALNVNLASGAFTQSTGNKVTWTAGNIENLTTGSGSDTLTGGAGNNILNGGAGDDIYAFGVNFGTDSIIEAVGNGNDTLDFSAFGTTSLNVDLSAGAFTQSTGNTVSWTAGNIENLTTGGGSDILTGTTGNNTLNGGAGDDTYKFIGAWGQDSITDTSGNDTLDLSAISNDLTVNLTSSTGNEVTDSVNTINWASGVTLETVLGGSGADFITGDGAANKLVGNGGNDTLTGGAGSDTLDGGAGDDTYMFASGFGIDNIIEAAGNGNDTLNFSAFGATGVNVDLSAGAFTQSTGNKVSWTAGNIENLTTGFGSDTLTGSTGDNVLNAGNGNNTLNGGTGNDTLMAGSANDTYVFGNNFGADSIIDAGGRNTLDFSGITTGQGVTAHLQANSALKITSGSNTVSWSTNFAANVNGTAVADLLDGGLILNGNSGNDTLIGSVGGSVLNGGAGNDLLENNNVNAGTDTYAFTGAWGNDTISDAGGHDVIDLTGVTANTTVNLSATSGPNVTAGTNTVVWGNSIIEDVLGGSGKDTITGNAAANGLVGGAGNDVLTGLAGDDTLYGGIGNDTLNGGDGNDTYAFDGAWGQDTITADSSGSADTLQFGYLGFEGANLVINLNVTSGNEVTDGTNTINFATAVVIENVLSGSGSDMITGNSSANHLFGGSGDDTLIGAAGNDTLVGEDGNDTYQFAKGDGQDVISDSGFTLSNLDRVQFNSTISQGSIAIFQNGNNLEIGYIGNTTDKITVENQFLANGSGQIERFELSNGNFMTAADINVVIQQMTNYAQTNNVSLTSLSAVESNAGLMNIIATQGWHSQVQSA